MASKIPTVNTVMVPRWFAEAARKAENRIVKTWEKWIVNYSLVLSYFQRTNWNDYISSTHYAFSWPDHVQLTFRPKVFWALNKKKLKFPIHFQFFYLVNYTFGLKVNCTWSGPKWYMTYQMWHVLLDRFVLAWPLGWPLYPTQLKKIWQIKIYLLTSRVFFTLLSYFTFKRSK